MRQAKPRASGESTAPPLRFLWRRPQPWHGSPHTRHVALCKGQRQGGAHALVYGLDLQHVYPSADKALEGQVERRGVAARGERKAVGPHLHRSGGTEEGVAYTRTPTAPAEATNRWGRSTEGQPTEAYGRGHSPQRSLTEGGHLQTTSEKTTKQPQNGGNEGLSVVADPNSHGVGEDEGVPKIFSVVCDFPIGRTH